MKRVKKRWMRGTGLRLLTNSADAKDAEALLQIVSRAAREPLNQ